MPNPAADLLPPQASGPAPLPEAWRTDALARVREVCRTLVQERATLARAAPGLSAGSAPAALLLASAAGVLDMPAYAGIACELMDHAIARMHPDEPALFHGASGILWAALQIDAMLGMDEYAGLADDYDDTLLERLSGGAPWDRHYDLISGLAGVGIYALERRAARRGPALLDGVLAQLARLSVRCAEGVYWPTTRAMHAGPWRGGDGESFIDLGMAHGNAGVVALLAAMLESGVPASRVRPLLDGALDWLLAQRLGRADSGVYRYTADTPASTRGAWCYGDFAGANALLLAGRSLDRPDLHAAALALLDGACRRSPASLQLADPWICHGYAGLAHLLRRARGLHAVAAFDTDAARLFATALAMEREAAAHGAAPTYSLVEGEIGNSLCYLDACGHLSYRWDRPFLFV